MALTISKAQRSAIAACFLLLGIGLLWLNVYGLSQSLRPEFSEETVFRFPGDWPLPYKESIDGLARLQHESDRSYVERLTYHVAASVGHIEWAHSEDVDRYHQRVPAWENYILYLMGVFTSIPEYQRYHFSSYKKGLERGIGVCGDVSIILSQVLREQGFDAKIVSYPGHVVVAVKMADGDRLLLDPDFGVVMPLAAEETASNLTVVEDLYSRAGYSAKEVRTLKKAFNKPPTHWDGVEHFISKKYYFEIASYYLIWLIPLLLILSSAFLVGSTARHTRSTS